MPRSRCFLSLTHVRQDSRVTPRATTAHSREDRNIIVYGFRLGCRAAGRIISQSPQTTIIVFFPPKLLANKCGQRRPSRRHALRFAVCHCGLVCHRYAVRRARVLMISSNPKDERLIIPVNVLDNIRGRACCLSSIARRKNTILTSSLQYWNCPLRCLTT